MQQEDISSLRDPSPTLELVDPSPLLKCMRHFIRLSGASRLTYEDMCEVQLLDDPTQHFLSYDQVKHRIRWLSGVVPIEHDMCLNSCLAYTGPYADLTVCPNCKTDRYFEGTEKPQRRFTTIPIGPVIQAFYGSRETADQMHYLERSLASNVDRVRANGGRLDTYNDVSCGKDLLDAWNAGTFGKSDVALQLSIDGAQLRPDQASEVWVFIWIIHNLPPGLRYKKRFVIPGAIVPGPDKPKFIDSYLFRRSTMWLLSSAKDLGFMTRFLTLTLLGLYL